MRLSLRTKWSLALLASTVVPLATIALIVTSLQRRGLERAEKELQIAVADEAAHTVEQSLGAAADVVLRVGGHLSDDRIPDDARIHLAQDAVGRSDHVDYVAVYDATGGFIDAVVHRRAPVIARPPGDLRPTPAAGGWVVRQTDGDIDVAFLAEIERQGTRSGWVEGHLARGELSKIASELSLVRYGTRDRLFFVDSTFHVIGADATAPMRPGTDLTRADIFGVTTLGPLGFAEPIALTTEYRDASGREIVGTLRTLQERKWALVVRRPVDEAYAALTETKRAFYAALGAVTLFALGLASWLARRAARPIESLARLTRAYAERDFSKKSDIATGDELQDLGDAMTTMAGALDAGERELLRRARIESSLARYMPEAVARSIANGDTRAELGGRRKRVCVLFADVANFTPFAERASPEEVVRFLNELFSILIEVVFRHGGLVDKFMGDCVMAIFGFEADDPHPGAAAIAAAEDMHRFVEAESSDWRKRFGVEVKLGIGIAIGEAVVGNLGSDERMEFTAVGDIVNVASRLEALARPGQTLVTKEVTEDAPSGGPFASLGEHPLRGKREPVELFEVAQA